MGQSGDAGTSASYAAGRVGVARSRPVQQRKDPLLNESSLQEFLDGYVINEHDTATPLLAHNDGHGVPSAQEGVVAAGSANASARALVTTARRQQLKKTWHQRRKEELRHLRKEVAQLTARLEDMKLAAGVRSRSSDASRNDAASPKQSGTRNPVSKKAQVLVNAALWAKIAARHSTLRAIAESRNAHLKAAVAEQRKQARTLRRAYQRRLREEIRELPLDLVDREVEGVRPPTDNAAVFDYLQSGMDELYSGLDSFFERVKMRDIPCPGWRSIDPPNRTRRAFVEFVDCRSVPFDFDQTWNVIRDLDTSRFKNPRAIYAEYFTGDSMTNMTSFSLNFSTSSVDFHVLHRKVVRTYVESNRVVFIVRTLIDIIRPVSAALLETARVVASRGPSFDLAPSTVLHSHREMSGHGNTSTEDPAFVSNPMVAAAGAAWKNSGLLFARRVEDAIMQNIGNSTLRG